MRKFKFFCSILLVVTIPLMVVILTSNLVLRTSELYTYHFNDSQVLNEISYSVEEADMANTISSYISSFSNKKIQVYEKNGVYKDPIFNSQEQKVMEKVKKIVNIELGIGMLLFAFTLGMYIYLWHQGFREQLRNRYRIGAVISIILVVGQAVCWYKKGFRIWIYGKLIGYELGSDSTLAIVLGDPFFKTYVLFATILAAALIAVLTYLNFRLTKPTRIFY